MAASENIRGGVRALYELLIRILSNKNDDFVMGNYSWCDTEVCDSMHYAQCPASGKSRTAQCTKISTLYPMMFKHILIFPYHPRNCCLNAMICNRSPGGNESICCCDMARTCCTSFSCSVCCCGGG